ncbi:peptidase, zinc-dependent [Methanoregula boonei 6A8]|jgi:archaemetzincin|uniref:Peptidase, zinc-dependent n=1 Tax=Methanoregula boonei (strain DSM 21154 / JCM 14090 / 6A8) TaxID=456442 RepID=A7I783_METB6|nr:archaemetzincin family Zn-dependent metalloprotease [Methanoregula boonei]ABS55594.1 peptidase, zinc-dependent [Methanoregula boonei 6A8]
MRLHIFWDQLSPEGLQLPAGRMIAAVTGLSAVVVENPVRIMGFVNARKQIDAQVQLDHLAAYKHQHRITDPILLVVSQDLFNAGHSALFGLAREQTGVAVISTARLANEYYGREPSDDALIDRIVTEGAHEAGHLLGLGHCTNRECIMFCPDTLDELDGKKKEFCAACRVKLEEKLQPQIDQI